MINRNSPTSSQCLYLTDADLARRIVTENTKRFQEACASLARRQAGYRTYDAEAHTAAADQPGWIAHPKVPLTLSEQQVQNILAAIGRHEPTDHGPLSWPPNLVVQKLVRELNRQRNVPSAGAVSAATRQFQATERALRALEADDDPNFSDDRTRLRGLVERLQNRALKRAAARAAHEKHQERSDRSIQLEFIRGPLADAYRHLSGGQLAGRHRIGSRPAGPFVRFTTAFFQELGEPVSEYQVEDALRKRSRRKKHGKR